MPGATSGRGGYRTGIDKRPRERIEVVVPARAGGASGVIGDHVGNQRHHGGTDKAVYAFSREELSWWESELGRTLPDGSFGENLTTEGVDLESLLIGQRVRLGPTVVLEVSLPRQPCATFQRHLAEPGWVRRFTARGRCGAYLRVVEPGSVHPGDSLEMLTTPRHAVDLITAFAAIMGDDRAAAEVVAARCLPPAHHARLERRLSGTVG